MPGVDVITGARPGARGLGRAPGATYMIAAQTERGSTTEAVEVRSMAEWAERLGGRVTYGYGYDDAEAFFAEGGTRMFVARVVGDNPTVGTLTLVDRAGTPANTLRVDAENPGAWSADVSIAITDGALANTFRVVVYLDGDVVETFYELSSPADAVAQVNARSQFIRLTDLGSATAAPNNNPAVIAATALSAGTDDRATIIASDYVTALARFVPTLGTGAVAIPGLDGGTVGPGLIAHARANRRLAILATPKGTSVSGAKAVADALRATAGAEFAGLFHPWVTAPDGAGGTRTISPEGYVAGVRARTHRDAGAWRVPAGEVAESRFVTGIEAVLTRAQVDDLADSRVNAVRNIAGTTRLYGWRSLSTDETNYKMLTARDLLNVIAVQAESILEQFVFAPVDGRGLLFGRIEGELRGLLDPIVEAGGLYVRTDAEGAILDNGYVVDTGPSVNTPDTLAANEVRANLALRLSPAAELVLLTVTKVAFDVAL